MPTGSLSFRCWKSAPPRPTPWAGLAAAARAAGVSGTMAAMPVEPPPTLVGLPGLHRPARGLGRRRRLRRPSVPTWHPGRCWRRTGGAPSRCPRGPASRSVVVAARPGRASARPAAGLALPGEVVPPDGGAGGHGVRRGGRARAPTRRATAGGSTTGSRRRTASCTGWAGRTRSRAWRRRRARRWAVRRRDRRAVRGRVDVPPGHRCVEGGARRAGGAALRRAPRPAAARRAVADAAPGVARGGRAAAGRTTPGCSRTPSRSRCRRGGSESLTLAWRLDPRWRYRQVVDRRAAS